MGSPKKKPRHAPFGEINITPLTDVFLVLLVIMIVVNPLLQVTGVPASVSDGEPTEQTEDKPKVIGVTVSAQGSYRLGDEDLDLATLTERLRAAAPEHPGGVVLTVEPDAPLERLTNVLDASRGAGIEQISLDKPEAPDTTDPSK